MFFLCAKFDKIPSMTQDIKERKRYGHTFVWTDGGTDGRENSIPSRKLYPPTQFAGGIKMQIS